MAAASFVQRGVTTPEPLRISRTDNACPQRILEELEIKIASIIRTFNVLPLKKRASTVSGPNSVSARRISAILIILRVNGEIRNLTADVGVVLSRWHLQVEPGE